MQPVCRTCGISQTTLIPLTNNSYLRDLMIQFLRLEPLEFLDNFGLCTPCKTTLENFNIFFLKSQAVDEKLRNDLETIGTYTIYEEDTELHMDIKIEPESSVPHHYHEQQNTDQHSPKESHQCSECSKVYASKATLNAHLKAHLDEFRCTVCSKTFSSRHVLIIHCEKIQ